MRHQVEAVVAADVEPPVDGSRSGVEAKIRAPHPYLGRLLAAMCGEGGGHNSQSFGPRMTIRKRNGAARHNLITSDYLCFNLLLFIIN
jgi:hypothetical protein